MGNVLRMFVIKLGHSSRLLFDDDLNVVVTCKINMNYYKSDVSVQNLPAKLCLFILLETDFKMDAMVRL